MMNRRTYLQGLGALAGLCSFGVVGQVPYPSRPIHLIVPFTPGGSSDILGRAIAKALNEAWHQPVIVENKPGAGGAIGGEAAAKATPDGYTLFIGHIGTLAVNPTLY